MQGQCVMLPNQRCCPLSPPKNWNLPSLLWPYEVVDNWMILTQESKTRSTLNIYAVKAGVFISFLRVVATTLTEKKALLIQIWIPSLATFFFWVVFRVFECPSGTSAWGCGDSNFPLSIHGDVSKQPLSIDLSQERKQVSGGCVFWHRNRLHSLCPLPPAPNL